MLKRHEVQVLRRAGHTMVEVTALTGVPERTIRRIEGEPEVATVDDGAERKRRRIGRPSVAEKFRPFVETQLKENAELKSLEILRRARLAGYQGKKTALYSLIAGMRPKPVRPLVRFEGLPGEFAQHDFGHVDVNYIDGAIERVHFFASRLKYSRWCEVSLVANEQTETLVRGLCEHYKSFGGVPLLSVFDRPKTVALKWAKDGTVTEWNHTFAQFMLELSVGVEVCWPARGQEKGSVENLVGWVKGSFFKQRRFIDRADLERQLSEWLHEVNERTVSRATGVIPAERLKEEAPRLRPLKVFPENLALKLPIFVGPTAMVNYEGASYSMSPETISLSGTLYLHRDHVRVVAGRFEAEHPRLKAGEKSILPEHRREMVQKVCGRRGKLYLKREHLLDAGESALDYLTELVHRRPREWRREVEALHELLLGYGLDAMRAAFAHANEQHLIGVEYVRHFLKQAHEPELFITEQEVMQ